LANTSDTQEALARQAVLALHRRGERLHVAPQNLIEFRSVATRPVSDNGLGFSLDTIEHQIATFEGLFPLLDETDAIYPAWKALVHVAGIIGKQVHDARLVAICQVYTLTPVLTFNIRHFNRLATYVPGFVVVHPADIAPREHTE
jgi:hypothetical protein